MLRKETAEPSAPLPPVPLHLQPPTPMKRPSLDAKKDKEKERLGSGELEIMLILKAACLCFYLITSLPEKELKPFYYRKETSDPKRRTSEHNEKDRSEA